MKKCFLIVAQLVLAVGCASPSDRTPANVPGASDAQSLILGDKGGLCGVFYRPAGMGPFPAVVVVHGDFGLNDSVKREAARLVKRGYVVLAVDLYRGQPIADLLDAHVMGRGLPDDRVQGDLRKAVDYLIARRDVRPDAVGILGWDLGGGYALDAALADPRLRAVVTCYGRLTTDPAALAPLRASVLGVFAGKDEGITAETIERFRSAMAKAGKRATVEVYPACGNGFLNPAKPAAAGTADALGHADAWGKIETFLGRELKP